MTSIADATRPATHDEKDRHRPLGRLNLRDDRWPDRFAAFTFALAAVVLVAWVVPPLHRYFNRVDDPVSLVLVPIVPNLVYAALLIALAVGLRRRLRAAWWVFVVLLFVLPSIGRVESVVAGDDVVMCIVGLVIAVVVLVVAVRARSQFTARTARAAGVKALLRRSSAGWSSSRSSASWLLSQFAELEPDRRGDGHRRHPVRRPRHGRRPRLLGAAVGAPCPVGPRCGRRARQRGGAVPVAAPTPAPSAPPTRPSVRTMLREHGDLDSLGYFATRRDKAVVWDSDDPAQARAGVSYRVVRGVSLASGNPVGDPEHWPAAIEAWRRDARANGWSLAVMAAGCEGARRSRPPA